MGATTTLLRTDDGRLLVRSPEGRRLGWHDLASGATHLSDSDAAGPVAEAVARYVARSSPLRDRRVTGLVPVQRAAPAAAVVVDPPTRDLRSRPAGGSRRQALLAQLQDPPVPARRRPFARRATGPVAELLADVRAALLVAHVLGEASGLLAEGRPLRAPGTWTVLHDLPLAHGRALDHLLVGPGGVVVVTSSARPGAPLPGASWFEPLDAPPGDAAGGSAQADPTDADGAVLEQVRLVRSLLAATGHGRVRVHGVVATTGRPRRAVAGLATSQVRIQDLPDWLRALPRVVSTVDVGRVADVLAAPSTWPTAAGSDQRGGVASG